MRFIVLDDDKVKSLIKSKEEIAYKIKDITKKIEDLEEDRNKLVLKIQRYNDKAIPLIDKYKAEEELGEFEEYSRVYFKDDELRLEIFDSLEEFKEFYKKQKEELKKKQEEDGKPSENKDTDK
jgi:seryl-tRNA synthetase